MFKRFLPILFIVGLFCSLSFDRGEISLSRILAAEIGGNERIEIIASTIDIETIERQGREKYLENDLKGAIDLWRDLPKLYRERGNLIGAARVSSNLALAYQQLGEWQLADRNIGQSLALLNDLKQKNDTSTSIEIDRTLAQAINTKATLELNRGNSQLAWETWQEAEIAYARCGDRKGVLRAKINQASALQALGFSRRSLKLLEEIKTEIEKEPETDRSLLLAIDRSLGNNLRLLGEFERAKILEEQNLANANASGNDSEKIESLLALAKISDGSLERNLAWQQYQAAKEICLASSSCSQSEKKIQIELAQFDVAVTMNAWQDVDRTWRDLSSELNRLPINHSNIYDRLNFAQNLISFKETTDPRATDSKNRPQWSEIAEIVATCAKQAESIGDLSARAYALGSLGGVYERNQQLLEAKQLTEEALNLALEVKATEIAYLWQWQLGRLERAYNNRDVAIKHYGEAVNSLKSLSKDLAAIDRQVQFSFRESVEPVYREFVSLLLAVGGEGNVSQANLELARETIESLQIAELDNFFKEACLQDRPVAVDKLDRNTAVIYPIILEDRLEVIVSIGDLPLKHYSSLVTAKELEQTATKLSQGLVIRSKRDFYEPSQKLYNWAIAPIAAELEQNRITNLVFIPDGLLRNVPMATLYDGEKFLIEKYSVAIAPSLKLLAPRSLQDIELKTIAVGLTKEREGFPALDYVQKEIEQIQAELSATILLDRDFTTEALQNEVRFSNSPIVHIATHGQFSSNLTDTFLVAWDRKIGASQIDSILQSRDSFMAEAIELLVLSACETATGDKRAALGLAGMAVRAGAKSTLATLWSVNDEATAEFMGYFYDRLKQKQIGKAEAVREAQLLLLQDSRYRHPFYWAPYILVGNWL